MTKSNYKEHMLLGIDFGSKFIGLASFVPGSPCPTPYGRIANKSLSFALSELKKIIQLEGIEVIIIGVPKLTDGKETAMTLTARSFLQEVAKNFSQCEVIEQDETLTTFEAKERMKNSPLFNFEVNMQKIDELSATIILEDFLKLKDAK